MKRLFLRPATKRLAIILFALLVVPMTYGTASAQSLCTTTPSQVGVASGANSFACGISDASGPTSTAVGAYNVARGVSSVAIGTGNNYAPFVVTSGDSSSAVGVDNSSAGFRSSALGFTNTSSNANATAVGSRNFATGESSLAAGYFNSASGSGSTALGYQNQANATNSTAIGASAVVGNSYSGSTVIGAGTNGNTAIASNATASNQIMLGNSSVIYAAPGITSATSRATQSGTTQFVTTDSNGNLANSSYGPQDIAGLNSSVSALNNSVGILGQTVSNLSNRVDGNQREARQGIAMAAAMGQAPMPSAPGKTSWKFNNSVYKNAAATSLSIAHRLPTRVPIAVTAGVAIGLRNSALVTGGMQGEF